MATFKFDNEIKTMFDEVNDVVTSHLTNIIMQIQIQSEVDRKTLEIIKNIPLIQQMKNELNFAKNEVKRLNNIILSMRNADTKKIKLQTTELDKANDVKNISREDVEELVSNEVSKIDKMYYMCQHNLSAPFINTGDNGDTVGSKNDDVNDTKQQERKEVHIEINNESQTLVNDENNSENNTDFEDCDDNTTIITDEEENKELDVATTQVETPNTKLINIIADELPMIDDNNVEEIEYEPTETFEEVDNTVNEEVVDDVDNEVVIDDNDNEDEDVDVDNDVDNNEDIDVDVDKDEEVVVDDEDDDVDEEVVDDDEDVDVVVDDEDDEDEDEDEEVVDDEDEDDDGDVDEDVDDNEDVDVIVDDENDDGDVDDEDDDVDDEEEDEDDDGDVVVDDEDNDVDEEDEDDEYSDDEAEVDEIVIDGTVYYTDDPENGIIYADDDGEVGDEVGVFKNSKPFFS